MTKLGAMTPRRPWQRLVELLEEAARKGAQRKGRTQILLRVETDEAGRVTVVRVRPAPEVYRW
jgi:hypothetical protein